MFPVSDKGPSDETSPRYAGWRVVLACFLTALFLFGFGLYGHGVYLRELQRLNGWSAALISGASTLSLLLANIFATFTNELMARLGARRLVLSGIAALAASTVLLAFATTPWQLYAAFGLMSLGWIGMGTVVIATVVNLWFVHRAGLAISLAYTGASSGGVVVAPLLVLLVDRLGFRDAMLTAAMIMVAVLVPAALAWIGPPPQGASRQANDLSRPRMHDAPSGLSRAQLMRHPAFWTVSIPIALALMAQVGFIVHQIALLEPKVGRAGAGFAVSVMTFMAIAGRLGLGAVIDRLDPRLAAAGSLISQAVALLVISQVDDLAVVLVAACAVFGFSVGNIITLPPLIIRREFGATGFVVVMGLSNAVSGTLGALGPGLVGLVRGWRGDYDAALALCIALELVAAVIVMQRGALELADGRTGGRAQVESSQ